MSIQEGYAAAKRASDHADRAQGEPLWSKVVWVRFLEYLLKIRMADGERARFTTCQFRAFALAHSVPAPPDARAFGNVTRKAASEKHRLIRDSGERVREGSHGREVVVWEVI